MKLRYFSSTHLLGLLTGPTVCLSLPLPLLNISEAGVHANQKAMFSIADSLDLNHQQASLFLWSKKFIYNLLIMPSLRVCVHLTMSSIVIDLGIYHNSQPQNISVDREAQSLLPPNFPSVI